MKHPLLVVPVCLVCVACAQPAFAETHMPQSVVASGGAVASGTNHTIVGTVGQGCVGSMAGTSYTHGAGFWHGAQWITVGIYEAEGVQLLDYWLGQSHPNPFNPRTTLDFTVPERAHVTMKLYDAGGRTVMTIVDRVMDRGHHSTVVHASGLASGVYHCRMTAGSYVQTRKLVLLK